MERLCRRPFRSMEDYATTQANAAAKLTGELHAQARANGRVLDDYVFRMGGCETLKVDVPLEKFIPLQRFAGWRIQFEYWPHDIRLRANMSTSVWQDLPAMVASREASILDQHGTGIPPREFLHILTELDEEPDTAAFRWALVNSDSLHMALQLQSMPATSTFLCGKPTMRK